MKVLFILKSFPKLSETFILNQIIGLGESGIELDILASRNTKEGNFDEDIKTQYKIHDIDYFDNNNSLFIRILKALEIIFNKPKTSFKYYKEAIKSLSIYDVLLTKKLLENKKSYDMVHAHFGDNGVSACKLKKSGLIGTKIITSFYGYDTSWNPIIRKKNYYGNLIEYGDLHLSLSEFMKQQLIRLGFPPNKILVHKLGIDINKFKFSTRNFTDTIKLLSIARLVDKKGLHYSIRAFKKVINEYDRINLEYNIVGDGEMWQDYKRLISDLGLEGKVNLLGSKTQNAVLNILYDSHIFILPSITAIDGDMEGTPVSLMEAMATGLPVISTIHSGIPEIVKDGITGYLVPEKNVELIANRILKLIKSPDVWPELVTSARKFIELNHDIEKLNKQLIDIYRTI